MLKVQKVKKKHRFWDNQYKSSTSFKLALWSLSDNENVINIWHQHFFQIFASHQ